GPLALFLLPLLALNGTFSANPHATLLALARLCLIALLGAALVAGAREGGARSIASAAAAAGTAAALVALWQGAIGFTMQAADIAALESPLRESALARLRSGRVFGTLLLPASLGGAIALTLPLTIAVAGSASRRGHRLLVGGAALVQTAALVWTFSLGAWLSLGVSTLAVLALPTFRRSAPIRRRALGGALLVAAIVAGGFAVRSVLLPAPGPDDRP